MSWIRLFVAMLMLSVCAPAVAGPCDNPRSAADSLFVNLTPTNYKPARAKQCLDVPAGADGAALAVRLKQVLDARGHWVPVSSLSVEPDFKNDEGKHLVVPMPDAFPVLVIERSDDGRWLYSETTLSQVDDLYRQTFSPLSLWFQSQLPAMFYDQLLGIHIWQYLYGFLLILAAALVGQIVYLLLRSQVVGLVKRAGLQLDPAVIARTSGPITAAVTFSIVAYGIPDLQLSVKLAQFLIATSWIGVMIAAAAVMVRAVDVVGDVALSWAHRTESKLDDQLIPLLEQAARVLVIVVTLFFVLDAVGIDVWKLAAGVGIGGLAFALAAQDTVANVFGSINIFIDKPFQIGDWVIIGKVEGVVEEVGFRSTRVRTFYNSVVTIPNSSITNSNVDNMGLRPRRRTKFSLGLTYDTPPDKLQAYAEGVRAILAAHPGVERTYEVHVYNLGPSSIDILVYYHLVVPGWHEELIARSQNILEFIRLAQELEVSFAFPSQSVYLEATPERPLPPHEPRSIAELQALADAFGPDGAKGRPDGPPFDQSWSVQARSFREPWGNKGSAADGPGDG